MNDVFFYEHVGHMQISVLTLELYDVILDLSDGQIERKIKVDEIVKCMENKGFPIKVINSEVERFFYGFESVESYNQSIRWLSLTQMGLDYINEIKKEIKQQNSELAFIVRDSRKKKSINAIIQETTFFSNNIYQILRNNKFRDGGARDFLKCIAITDFEEVIKSMLPFLEESGIKEESSLEECIELVKYNGKYWSGVSSKYSWIFFKQKYELEFSINEWKQYQIIIDFAKRPVEWGGNARDIPQEFMNDNNIDIAKFLDMGIIRRLFTNGGFSNLYRLTAPGFLMFERKQRGFLLECILRKEKDNCYVLDVCNASDRNERYSYGDCNELIKSHFKEDKSTILSSLHQQLLLYKNRGEIFYGL